MARVNHTVDDCHAVSAAMSIQSRAVKQVSLQCEYEGVDRLESADVMRLAAVGAGGRAHSRNL